MLNNPCNLSLDPVNTGIECQAKMLATAMLIFMPKGATFTKADIIAAGSFTDLLYTKMHLPAAQRWFVLFGHAAPVRMIADSNEADVFETYDDGTEDFIRYGKYNRTYSTNAGGLCLAQHLMRFPEGFAFLDVDIASKVLSYEKSDGVYAGVPTSMIKGLAPDLATLKTSFKNKLRVSFDPTSYIVKGKIFTSDDTEDILNLNGLLDTVVTPSTTTKTITTIFFGVETQCAETDLVELYPGSGAGTIAQVTNFIVTNANGTPNTPSAATIVNGEIRLTGTFATGTNIKVKLAPAATLKTNGIEGYEGVNELTIAIP